MPIPSPASGGNKKQRRKYLLRCPIFRNFRLINRSTILNSGLAQIGEVAKDMACVSKRFTYVIVGIADCYPSVAHARQHKPLSGEAGEITRARFLRC